MLKNILLGRMGGYVDERNMQTNGKQNSNINLTILMKFQTEKSWMKG